MRARPFLVALLLLGSALPVSGADDTQLARGLQAIQRMTGCFLVDYSDLFEQASIKHISRRSNGFETRWDLFIERPG